MKKTVKSVVSLIIALFMCFSLGCVIGCDQENSGYAVVKVANSSDKILRAYSEDSLIKDEFMGNLTDDFSFSVYQNEYESKQLIITATKRVYSFDVKIKDFKCGDNVLDISDFEIYQEFYHNVGAIYATHSQMEVGEFPDALIPFEIAKDYKINRIEKGNNQGVYITLFVPKGQQPGVYSGSIEVVLNDKETITVNGAITVLDYELPDTVSLPTCIPIQGAYVVNGELNSTTELYNTYYEHLKKYRLAGYNLEPNGLYSGLSDEEYYERALSDATIAVPAAQDIAVSAYSIRYLGESSSEFSNKNVLNERVFDIYMRAYIDKSIEENVDLFKKAYIYLGSIIDEPYLTHSEVRANYVCRQVADRILVALEYAEEQGASEELKESIRNLRHIVTNAWSSELEDVPYYCPQPDDLDSAAKLDMYQNLYKEDKGFWWYTCTIPNQPYPTVHLDDNGTPMRLMGWMAKKYNIGGYLTWESAYYMTYDGTSTTQLYGYDNYTIVERWGGGIGDGFCFYPGALFGLEEPIDSIRLPIMRDGMEEYEALNDLENRYNDFSTLFGETVSYDGLLNELYTYLFNRVKCYASSNELDQMHVVLGRLLELANKGIAISDFKANTDGTITCKIYSKNNANIKINGSNVNFTAIENGYVANVKTDNYAFNLQTGNCSFDIPVGELVYCSDFTDKVSGIEFRNVSQKIITTASADIEKVPQTDIDALHLSFNSDCALISIPFAKGNFSSDTRKITLEIYSDVKMNVSLIIQAGSKARSIDSFVVNEGNNVIEIARIQDLDIGGVLSSADKIYLSFTVETGNNNLYVLGLKAVK